MRDIKVNTFTGMNNVVETESFFVDEGVAQPRIVLNADVTAQGQIKKRDGYTKKVTLSGAHSVWGGVTCMLAMAGTTLYRIEGTTATSMGSLGGTTSKTFYEEVGNLVYISNRYTNKVFNPATNALSAWGLAIPAGPVPTSGNGSLEAGTYHVCLTTYDNNNLSGNSPIVNIQLTSTGGITLTGRTSNTIVWCTDPNGDIFYRVGDTDTISSIPTVEPLPTLFVSQPPYMDYICYAFGRMWGSRGNILYYSEPFHLDWFKLGTNYFEFATTITMVARMRTGLFIGCEDRTYCLLGTDPKEMQQLDVGAGAVPGTLAYCNNIIELGDTISPPEKKHVSVPVWVSQEGIVAGNPVGRIFNLSQGKVKFAPGNEGAALYRQRDGDWQYMSTFYSGPDTSAIGMSDEATLEVMRDGEVI